MSVKEGKITQKDQFDYEKWGLTKINSMLCSLGFNEHDKDIKYTRNIFRVLVESAKKRKLSSYRGFLFRKFSPSGLEKR